MKIWELSVVSCIETYRSGRRMCISTVVKIEDSRVDCASRLPAGSRFARKD